MKSGPPMGACVRDAVEGDRDAVASMLSRAFADDPVVRWLRADARDRLQRSARSFGDIFDADAGGLRLVAGAVVAASLWRYSRASERAEARADRSGSEEPDEAARRARLFAAALRDHMPSGDYWYLHVAGCEPGLQGKGVGRAILAAGLERTGGSPVYLETGNPRNIGFYEAAGFTIRESWSLSGGGPQMWSMMRPPG